MNLYFDGRQDIRAVILANGHLRHEEFSGSIHQVAKGIQGSPRNGWECWFFLDPVSGKLEVIDCLRQRLRERLKDST